MALVLEEDGLLGLVNPYQDPSGSLFRALYLTAPPGRVRFLDVDLWLHGFLVLDLLRYTPQMRPFELSGNPLGSGSAPLLPPGLHGGHADHRRSESLDPRLRRELPGPPETETEGRGGGGLKGTVDALLEFTGFLYPNSMPNNIAELSELIKLFWAAVLRTAGLQILFGSRFDHDIRVLKSEPQHEPKRRWASSARGPCFPSLNLWRVPNSNRAGIFAGPRLP